MKEMTSEELASCNGKDGKPVYVAFQGRVYDVTRSRLWSTGSHMKRHPSGKDLAGEILQRLMDRRSWSGIHRLGSSEGGHPKS